MKRSILTKLIGLVSVVIFVSLTVISFANYRMTYLKVKESAGIELFGCANITTGLLTRNDIDSLNSLTSSQAEELGEKIDWTTAHKPIFENQYIMSIKGQVLVPDEKSNKQGIKVGDMTPVDEDILNTLLETKAPVFSDVYDYSGMKRLTGYAPIFKNHDMHGEIVAISAIDFDAEILTERTWSMVSSTIIVGIISLLAAGTIIILYVRKTILPLKFLTEYTKRISEGDLSKEATTIKATGEIRILNENFNIMVENLKSALLQTASTSKEVASSTEELSVNTSEVVDIVEEISATFQNVAESSNHQAIEAEHIQAIFQKIATQTNDIAERIKITTKNSREVSDYAVNGNVIIGESIKQMDDIRLSSTNVSKTMHELKEKSDRVKEILNIIMNVSKQTNLLALNASIESARAGEHGKGFAIVAEEIRTLAEETSKSIESIKSIVFEIESKTTEAVQLSEQGDKIVQIGMEKVKNAGHSFNEIKESTKGLSEEVEHVLTSTVEIQEEISAANIQIINIASISKEISSQMQDVALSSEQQTGSMEEVSAAIQMLVHTANEMEKLANRFKI
ncbi:methyl-accepting chemotaxis protein [Cytobacillus solani]|uniref:methyl-accepting chemotaxis protein n=1 Tax=Cytobacillus solani TaxID=1637975 RepID=UPI00155F56E2|nr:methyl-accepting chemotaxis protein [Cytobacillus solani]USK55435.1 methyl-accepting chemotaxis protein [Cytobacillus solani]